MAGFRLKARYFIYGVTAMAVAIPITLRALETVPLTFKKGDLISAEVLNSIFASINDANRLPTRDMFIGIWNCVEHMPTSSISNAGYTPDESGFFGVRSNSYTFTAGATPNSMKLSSSNGFPILPSDTFPGKSNSNLDSALTPASRYLIIAAPEDTTRRFNFDIVSVKSESFELFGDGRGRSTCVKQTAKPAPPDQLTVSRDSNNNVVLVWTDQSDNETGFKVQRRSTSSDTFSTVTTTAENVTTYMDVSAGTDNFVYRVLSTNSNNNTDSISSSTVMSK